MSEEKEKRTTKLVNQSNAARTQRNLSAQRHNLHKYILHMYARRREVNVRKRNPDGANTKIDPLIIYATSACANAPPPQPLVCVIYEHAASLKPNRKNKT